MSSCKYSFKIFYISFCKIKSNQNIFNSLVGALAKNGSLAFAEGLACGRGKSQCAVCGLAVFLH